VRRPKHPIANDGASGRRPPFGTQLRRLAVVRDAVPPEGPADHVRNALQVLAGHESAHPAVWQFSPELRSVEALLFKALFQIEGAR